MRLASEEDLLVRVERRVGGFVPEGATLAPAWPPACMNEELSRRLHDCFTLGPDRTMQQDPDYGVIQLSDIGVKALSPGINDPTTAITCLHYLGGLPSHLGAREIPSPLREDTEGCLRVIAPGPDFERMADLAFSQIRHYGESDPSVTLSLLETLAEVAEAVEGDESRRQLLRRHVEEVAASAARSLHSAGKRAEVEQAVKRAREVLSGEG